MQSEVSQAMAQKNTNCIKQHQVHELKIMQKRVSECHRWTDFRLGRLRYERIHSKYCSLFYTFPLAPMYTNFEGGARAEKTQFFSQHFPKCA